MSKPHAKIVRDLGILEDSEKIRYFYSDALVNIRNGMCFVTDSKLVLYNENWAEPQLAVPLHTIVDAQVEYNESFFEDS